MAAANNRLGLFNKAMDSAQEALELAAVRRALRALRRSE